MSASVKKILLAAVCMCLFLTTACGSGETEKEKAMGRYVERLLDYPIENGKVLSMLQRIDGSIDVYLKGTDKLKLYNTQDGETWTEKKFRVNLPEYETLQDVFYDDKDQVYLNTADFSGSSIGTKVYRMEADGTLIYKKMEYQDESGGKTSAVVNDFKTLKNGKFVGVDQLGEVVQYSADGKYERSYGKSERRDDLSFTAYENTIYVLDRKSGIVSGYDAESEELTSEVSFDVITDQTRIASTKSGTVYLYNEKGIFRLAKGGSMWQKVVDGDLTTLSSPSISFFGLVEGQDGSIYLSLGSNGKSQLAKYTYDKTIATLPEIELVVYTLSDNKTLRQAAGEFQRSHPNTKINIQVAMGEDTAATKLDFIRTLNAELLNKKGPDILLLDGMPVENYIEKDVLADLSGVLKDLDSEKMLNKAVVDTYKNEKGIYAVPTKFAMTVMLADHENLINLKDLRSVAQFATENPEVSLIGDKSPSHLTNVFLSSCAPAWIKNNQINEEKLSEFLQSIKKIASVGSESYELQTENMSMSPVYGELGLGSVAVLDTKEASWKRYGDLFPWAYGRSHAAVLLMTGYNSLIDVNAAKLQKEAGVLVAAPGQVENAFIPMSIVGVNANSKELERAKDFVKLMLSDSVQNAELDDGFAVNRNVLKKQATEVKEDMLKGMGSPFDVNEMLMSPYPPKEELEELLKLCEAVRTPFVTDSTLMEIILDETAGYFAGEKDLNKTMADINEATRLYLSE